MDGQGSVDEVIGAFGLDAAQTGRLKHYIDLIVTWRECNITALRTCEDVARDLVADALSLLDVPCLPSRLGEPWVDLGAGAGIPGLPLCMALPDVRLTLLESVGKKCRFLEAAVSTAGLDERAQVVCARSERFAAKGEPGREAFAVVLARAVAPLPVLVELAAPLLQSGGVLLASKTHRGLANEGPAGREAADLCGLAFSEVVPLPRSSLRDAVCVVFEKTQPTPEMLPRREGMAAKKPLATAESQPSPKARTLGTIGLRAKGVR